MTHLFLDSAVALVTPFTQERTIDWQAFEHLVTMHRDQNTQALVIHGTTAEAPALEMAETQQLIGTACQLVGKKKPVIASIGGPATQKTLKMMMAIADNHPISAFLVVTPYYNRPTDKGLIQHYLTLAEHSPKPIILYNVPKRTAVDLTPDVVALLAQHDNIIGIKDATGDLSRVEPSRYPEHFSLWSGDDGTALEFLSLGGQGVISVCANAFPNFSQQCFNLARRHQPIEGAIKQAYQALSEALSVSVNPIPIKRAMAELGMIENVLREPLLPLEPNWTSQLITALQGVSTYETTSMADAAISN